MHFALCKRPIEINWPTYIVLPGLLRSCPLFCMHKEHLSSNDPLLWPQGWQFLRADMICKGFILIVLNIFSKFHDLNPNTITGSVSLGLPFCFPSYSCVTSQRADRPFGKWNKRRRVKFLTFVCYTLCVQCIDFVIVFFFFKRSVRKTWGRSLRNRDRRLGKNVRIRSLPSLKYNSR